LAIANIDPASMAGIALTVLSYTAAVSFVGLLAQIIFVPYFLTIAVREFGARGFFFVGEHEAYELRRKYPLYRFLWNLSLTMGVVFVVSLTGIFGIYARYSL
jgi:hypothetical protein